MIYVKQFIILPVCLVLSQQFLQPDFEPIVKKRSKVKVKVKLPKKSIYAAKLIF